MQTQTAYKDIDVRNLTRGQLIESYADLKRHAGKLAEQLQRVLKQCGTSQLGDGLWLDIHETLDAYKGAQ